MGVVKVKKVDELQVTKLFFKHTVTEDGCVRDGQQRKGNYSRKKSIEYSFQHIHV